jgi:hypothetical protein
MRSSSKIGLTASAKAAVFSGVKLTYHALCGSMASERPTMRSLYRSNPVVSVSKQNSSQRLMRLTTC